MESWEGHTYKSIMQMPSSRRIRLILQKSDLEKKRRDQHAQDVARAKRR